MKTVNSKRSRRFGLYGNFAVESRIEIKSLKKLAVRETKSLDFCSKTFEPFPERHVFAKVRNLLIHSFCDLQLRMQLGTEGVAQSVEQRTFNP